MLLGGAAYLLSLFFKEFHDFWSLFTYLPLHT